MTEWFRRKSQNIKTSIKRDTKEGMWIKCPDCGEVVYSNMLATTYYMCPSCSHHFNFTGGKYIDLLLDKENRVSISDNIISNDPLSFTAIKNYKKQINDAINKTNNNDAILSYSGYIDKLKVVVVALDFAFIGGSMGSVVGEVISQSIEFADKNNQPLIIISASGGARMQEGSY